MKKLIPLMLGMALTFGAVSMYGNAAGPQKTKSTAKKSTVKKSTVKKS